MPRDRPTRLTEEERRALARRYRAGETPKVLAACYGISRRHVTRLAREVRGEGLAVRDPSVAVSFRAARSEVALFDAEWGARGFGSRSAALRALVRARCGLLDAARDDLRHFGETLARAQGLAETGRVLAKAAARGHLVLGQGDREVLAALLDLAEETRRGLQGMQVAAGARRGQGWRADTSGGGPGR